MKFLIPVLMIFLSSKSAYSITQKEVDKIFSQFPENTVGPDNKGGYISWWESKRLTGYLQMYIATKDKKYLKSFITKIDELISRMDINIQRKDQLRNKYMYGWSATKYNPGHKWNVDIVGTGMIATPMAKFTNIVAESPDLVRVHYYVKKAIKYYHLVKKMVDQFNNELVPLKLTSSKKEEEKELSPMIKFKNFFKDFFGKTETPDKSLSLNDNSNLKKYSGKDFYHEYTKTHYFYRFPKNGHHRYTILPYNQGMAIGRAMIQLYRFERKRKPESARKYKDMIIKIGTYFKRALTYNPKENTYLWKYAPDAYFEDFSHGAIDIRFVVEAYNNNLLFDRDDMRRFTNTYLNHATKDPETGFHQYINGRTLQKGAYHFACGAWSELAYFTKSAAKPCTDFINRILKKWDTSKLNYRQKISLNMTVGYIYKWSH